MRQWLDETGTAPCSRRAQASRLTASELSSMWKVCLCQGQSTSFNPPFHLEPSTSFLRNPPRWRWVAGLPTVLAIDVPTSRAGRATHSFQNKSQVEKKNPTTERIFLFLPHFSHFPRATFLASEPRRKSCMSLQTTAGARFLGSLSFGLAILFTCLLHIRIGGPN